MDSKQELYEYVGSLFEGRVFFAEIEKSHPLFEKAPTILIDSVTNEISQNKDVSVTDIETYRIHVFSTSYNESLGSANYIKEHLTGFQGDYISHVVYEGMTHIKEDDVRLFRHVLEYRIFVNNAGVNVVLGDYLEHEVNINVATINKLNTSRENYIDITWTSSAPYQSWVGTLSKPIVNAYMKLVSGAVHDRIRIVTTPTTITITSPSSGIGDPIQINDTTFLIQFEK